jgi:hypothetical protein
MERTSTQAPVQRPLRRGFLFSGAASIVGRGKMAYYWLTPPSRAVFFLSVLLAVLALLVRYAHIAIPVVSHYTFETLLLGFLLLLAGNLFKGF